MGDGTSGRARDARLERDAVLKVLPVEVSGDQRGGSASSGSPIERYGYGEIEA